MKLKTKLPTNKVNRGGRLDRLKVLVKVKLEEMILVSGSKEGKMVKIEPPIILHPINLKILTHNNQLKNKNL